jgi:3D (Asp-Asp-Asp) domain-containing protein
MAAETTAASTTVDPVRMVGRHRTTVARRIAGSPLSGYPKSVRRLATLLVLCALSAAAPARAFELVPQATDALIHPEVTKGDMSKVDERLPEKLAVRSKVKECCGYPIASKEGFRLSFYWLAYEVEYANEPYDTDIYTTRGYFIGRYPSAFVYELKLEGSGILRDGRVLNFAGECNYGMGTCFKTLDGAEDPLGVGVQSRPLVPFRSIAVDPKMIPIGAPVYVPELVGIPMPDGSVHDGCLRADDMGGAIKNGKLDFFVESYFNFKFIGDALWWRLKATPTLEEPRCEYLRTYEPRERMNEHTDWVFLHNRLRTLARNERIAAAKTARNRRIAAAWVKRQNGLGGAKVAAKGVAHKK